MAKIQTWHTGYITTSCDGCLEREDIIANLKDKLHRRNMQIKDLKEKDYPEKIWCEAGDCKSHGNTAGKCNLQSAFNSNRLGSFSKVINSTGHCNNYQKLTANP